MHSISASARAPVPASSYSRSDIFDHCFVTHSFLRIASSAGAPRYALAGCSNFMRITKRTFATTSSQIVRSEKLCHCSTLRPRLMPPVRITHFPRACARFARVFRVFVCLGRNRGTNSEGRFVFAVCPSICCCLVNILYWWWCRELAIIEVPDRLWLERS